jgi:hypothetical protein
VQFTHPDHFTRSLKSSASARYCTDPRTTLGILFRLRHGRCVVAFTAKQRVCSRTQQQAPRGDSSRDGSSGHQELDDIE